MKSVVIISILLVIICPAVISMSVRGGMFRDPNNPGMCTLDNNMVLKEGDVVRNPNGNCEILTCYKNGHVSIMGCVKPGMREGCTEGEVLSPGAMYPECCERKINCKTDYYSGQK